MNKKYGTVQFRQQSITESLLCICDIVYVCESDILHYEIIYIKQVEAQLNSCERKLLVKNDNKNPLEAVYYTFSDHD